MNIRQWIAPLLFLFALVQLAAFFVSGGFADALVSGLALAIVALMIAVVRGAGRRTSVLLLMAGAAMLAAGGAGIGELAEALRFYGNLATLLLLAPLLSLPVRQGGFDRAMKVLLDRVGRKPAGYASIATGLSFFTSIFLHVGSLALIHSLTGHGEGKRARVQCLSLSRGFTSAMLVSPYSVAVAMIVSNFGLGLFEFFSVTVFMVFIFVGLHLAECYWLARGNESDGETAAPPAGEELPDGRTAGRRLAVLALALVLLIGTLLMAESLTNYPMVTLVCVLSLAVPVIGFAAMGRVNRLWPAFREHYWSARLPEMGKEIFLTLSAGFFGYAIQQSGAAGRLAEWAAAGNIHVGLAALILIHLFMLAFALIGFHPVVIATVLISLLSSDSFGLPPMAAPAALSASWSLATVFSPFSATSIILGGIFRKSPAEISLVWNWRYTALTLAAVVLFEYLYFFL